MPGPKAAGDFHLTDKGVQLINIFPWSWKETAVADGLGESYTLSLWSQTLHVIFGLFAFLNIPFEIQEKLFGLSILTLGFWGIWKLLNHFNINNTGKIAGSTLFLLNSFFLLLFDGGQLSLALSYGILPWVLFYFLKADKLKFVFWMLILSIADIRIIYLVLLIVFVYLFFDSRAFLKRSLITGILTGVILLGFHMYWLLPTLFSKQIQLPLTYERVSQISFLSFSSLAHSVLLQQPHWPENIFGKVTSPRAEFILIPFLVFSTLVLVKKNATVAFWLLVAIVSIFLSKGSNEPLGEVYSFLFKNIPGFSLFRDPTKFYFLVTLSYSILIGFSVQALSKFKLIPFLLIFYFIFLSRPAWLGNMNGLLSFPSFQEEFDSLQNDTNFSRIFWIPTTTPLGYVSPLHPAVGADRLSQKRPFAVGIKGTYETFNFLREAPYMGEIFDVAGIGYIAYPYLDPQRNNLHPDNIKYYYTFLDQLSKKPWLSLAEGSKIPLLRTKEHQDKFFITPNLWWVIGSDSIYEEATKSAKLKLSKNALIFAEERADIGSRLDKLPEAKIVLNKKTNLDLAASLTNPENLIFPAKNLDFEPNKTGWWKREAADLVRWRSFLQEKYGIDNQDFDIGGGWAVGEGKRQFSIFNFQFSKGKILLTRVMESSRSGVLKFYQNDQEIGEITTKVQDDANVRWFEVGQLTNNNDLVIESEGDINVVNALAVLDKDEWVFLQSRARNLQGRIVDFDEKNAISDISAKVIYQKINPTKYKVNISNLKSPATLIYQQNYDHLWKMDGRSSLPVYSYLNGFIVDRDGEYIIEYEAQRYVYFGLAISGIMAICLSLFFLRRRLESPK